MVKQDKILSTDLVGSDRYDNVVIFQPQFTAPMKGISELHDLNRHNPHAAWTETYRKIMNQLQFLELTHWGTMAHSPASTEWSRGPHIKTCGGRIIPAAIGEYIYLECSKCMLGLKSDTGLPYLLLHLLLKQLMPNLRIANYLTSAAAGAIGIGIRKLKIVSDKRSGREAHLGFTLMPGVRTTIPLSELDGFLQFAVQAKFDQIKEIFQHETLPTVIGPKYKGDSHGCETSCW